MPTIAERKAQLKRDQERAKAQLQKGTIRPDSIIPAKMDESAFLDDIASQKRFEKTFMRRSKRMSKNLYVSYDFLPITKTCKLCGAKKHFRHTIIENRYHFICPDCKEEAPAVYIQIRWRNNIYKIEYDDKGNTFKTVSEARYYASVLDDKAECGTNAHVYFIQAESNGHIKIGFSNNIKGRFADLRISCPCKLKVLLVLAGGVNIETLHHNHFQEHHSHGEWYLPHESLLSYIEANKPYCQKTALGIE